MDEAFLNLHELLLSMTALEGEIVSKENGFGMQVSQVVIETPVELSVVRGSDGKINIGTVPPLYPVETSFLPVFHSLTLKTEAWQQ